jgi:hypothetical protein
VERPEDRARSTFDLATLEVVDMKGTRARTLVIFGAGTLIVALAASTVSAAFRTSRSAGATTEERLPDLDQEVPGELAIRVGVANGHRVYELGFRSAVINVGAGPLLVSGARRDRQTPEMVVNQLIARAGGPTRVVRAVGHMKYVTSPTHQHWHYLEFDRYQLRRADPTSSSPQPIVSDRKTGFCLGDRYRTTGRFHAEPPARPVHTGSCGLRRPDLLRMTEGISVGYGDDYSGFLEGQQLPIEGLPNGRYVLVHRVNGDRRLRELSYSNNAASLLLDLHWQRGAPSLHIIASCPDTDRCDRTVPASSSRS